MIGLGTGAVTLLLAVKDVDVNVATARVYLSTESGPLAHHRLPAEADGLSRASVDAELDVVFGTTVLEDNTTFVAAVSCNVQPRIIDVSGALVDHGRREGDLIVDVGRLGCEAREARVNAQVAYGEVGHDAQQFGVARVVVVLVGLEDFAVVGVILVVIDAHLHIPLATLNNPVV